MSDLILINGKIVTVDDKFSIAQAVAIKNGRIAATGSNTDIQALRTPKSSVLDLKGRMVLPGINDSHIHASLFGGTLPPMVLDINEVRSPAAIAEMVADKARGMKSGEWVRGIGLDTIYAPAGKRTQPLPTRWDLDSAAPSNPVCLGVAPFHGPRMALLNTLALEMARIGAKTPIPSGGEIVKDDSGEPTGLLIGAAAEALTSVVPPFTRNEKRQAIKSAIRRLNSLGITSITEPGLGPGGKGLYGGLWDNDCIDIYRELDDAGEMTVRVSILLLFTPYGAFDREMVDRGIEGKPLSTNKNSEWLRIAGIKLYADGIPPMHTAWMSEAYTGGGTGKMVFPGASIGESCRALDDIVRDAHDLGYQVGIHATGDRSISACIASFCSAERAKPRGLRHYIIHGDYTPAAEAPRMKQFNVGLSVQPALAAAFLPMLRPAVGPIRAEQQLALKTLIGAGVHVAGSSDSPVMSPDWRRGVQAAVLREGSDGRVFSPEQKLSLEQAIRMYTIEGAWQDHMEEAKGSIEPGKLADFCILDGNILDRDPHTIRDLKIAMTIAGGEIVYDALS